MLIATSDVSGRLFLLEEAGVSEGGVNKRSIVFFLVPDFTMIAFATALEPLRSANRMLGYEGYRWRGLLAPAEAGVAPSC